MSETTPPERGYQQRLKMALIPVLALLLVGLVFWPDSAQHDGIRSGIDSGIELAERRLTERATTTSAAEIASPEAQPGWPKVDLDGITRRNPFERSAAIRRLFGEPLAADAPAPRVPPVVAAEENAQRPVATEETEAPLASGESRLLENEAISEAAESGKVGSLQAILKTDQGWTALIDSKVLHAGDVTASGYRIIAITPNSVTVAPAEDH